MGLFFGGNRGYSSKISENFLSNLGLANVGEVFSSCEAVGGRVLLVFLGGFSYYRIGEGAVCTMYKYYHIT